MKKNINDAFITIHDRKTNRSVDWAQCFSIHESERFTTEDEVKDFLLIFDDFIDDYKDTTIDVEYSWGNEKIEFTWER